MPTFLRALGEQEWDKTFRRNRFGPIGVLSANPNPNHKGGSLLRTITSVSATIDMPMICCKNKQPSFSVLFGASRYGQMKSSQVSIDAADGFHIVNSHNSIGVPGIVGIAEVNETHVGACFCHCVNCGLSDFGVDSTVAIRLSVARNNPMLSCSLLFTSFVNDGTDPGRIY